MKYRHFLLLLALVVWCQFHIASVYADSINLNLSPSVTKIVTKPGSSPVLNFNLRNDGDPTLVKFNVVPFQAADNFGHVILGKKAITPIQFSLQTNSGAVSQPLLMKSNSVQPLTLTLHIDPTAAEKDYYYSFLVQTIPFPASDGETVLQLSTTVGSHLLISVTSNGKLEQKASIALLKVPASSWGFLKTNLKDSFKEIPTKLILNNDGRNNFSPKIIISVDGWNLHKKYLISPRTVLSSSQREVDTVLTGLYIGKYSITSTIKNDQGETLTSAVTSFVAFPFSLTVAALILLTLFFFLKKYLRRNA